jgi:hypothetical protein
MSRKKTLDPVADALAKIERIYTPLPIQDRRRLEDELLRAPWFGTTVKLRWGLTAAKLAYMRAKDHSRSRKPSPEIAERNVLLKAEHAAGKSYARIAKDHKMPVSTVRNAIKSAPPLSETGMSVSENDTSNLTER